MFFFVATLHLRLFRKKYFFEQQFSFKTILKIYFKKKHKTKKLVAIHILSNKKKCWGKKAR